MQLRKADIADIENVMQIFSQARKAQRAAGFTQWEDGYPSVDILKADIDNNKGYVMEDKGRAAAYVAIATQDAEYERFPQLWKSTEPYAVFHRIAICDEYRGKGLSSVLFDLAEDESRRLGAEAIRIDTGLENRPMQHILSKRGYANLGPCEFVWGMRLAFEKVIASRRNCGNC